MNDPKVGHALVSIEGNGEAIIAAANGVKALREGIDTAVDIEKLSADVRRLEYGPGDAIVITAPERTRMADLEEIKARVQPNFPDNKVMVLTGGLEIGVMHPSGDMDSPSA